jgi:hypothetical protein
MLASPQCPFGARARYKTSGSRGRLVHKVAAAGTAECAMGVRSGTNPRQQHGPRIVGLLAGRRFCKTQARLNLRCLAVA